MPTNDDQTKRTPVAIIIVIAILFVIAMVFWGFHIMAIRQTGTFFVPPMMGDIYTNSRQVYANHP
jgi:hypothetical protein